MDTLDDFKKYFNRDFWRAFPNKQVFSDIPRNESERENIIEQLYKEIIEKEYYPSIPKKYIDRNKGQGVTRIIPVFALRDYCIYYYCIKKLENKIADNRIPNTFGGWTLGGLIRRGEDDEIEKRKIDFDEREHFLAELEGASITEYSFNPAAWAAAYGDLNAKLYLTAQEGDYKYVAELDIANYYDSIRLDILEIRIREMVDKDQAEIISLLFHFLNYWNRKINLYNKQTVGIPQDAMGDCSRILANFYLQLYDKYVFELCNQNNCRYLRYADDQFLFSKEKDKLLHLIFKVSKKLNCLGLSINQKKVKMRTTDELIEHRSFKIFDVLKNKQDRENKQKVEIFIDYYLDLLDKKGLKNIKNNGNSLLNRALFSPALKDIDIIKKIKLIGCYLDDDYLESSKSMHFQKIYELLSGKDKKEFINKLIKLSDKLFHNAFHYEVLDFFMKNKINHNEINKRIEQLETI